MDYINFAIEQLEKEHSISSAFAREQYNALKASQMPAEWRKEVPTKEGWYLAVANIGILSAPEFVRVIEYFPGDFAAERTGTDQTTHLDFFEKWLGPFPTMDGEK